MSPAAEAQTNPRGAVPDAALLERVARRDEQGLGELRARYAGTLYAVVYGILGNPSDAEHVVSETFLEVWRHAADFRADLGTVHGWLGEIARRRARSLNRERTARRTTWRTSPPLTQPST
jgi:RNA polymerase sigma-70 factor (ECF subfamily)